MSFFIAEPLCSQLAPRRAGVLLSVATSDFHPSPPQDGRGYVAILPTSGHPRQPGLCGYVGVSTLRTIFTTYFPGTA